MCPMHNADAYKICRLSDDIVIFSDTILLPGLHCCYQFLLIIHNSHLLERLSDTHSSIFIQKEEAKPLLTIVEKSTIYFQKSRAVSSSEDKPWTSPRRQRMGSYLFDRVRYRIKYHSLGR